MNNILIILFCLFYNFAISQTQNIDKYFDNINKAELAIAKSDYKNAFKLYKKAFKNHDEPFNYDYQNALLCSCQLGKKQSVKMYFIALKQRDIDLKKIEKHCVKNVSETYWNELEQLNISITIDTIYRQELVEILRKDQAVRNYMYSVGGNYNTHQDTIVHVDSLNMLAIKELIKIKGFPTDGRVGNSNILLVPILHNRQSPNLRNDLDDLLYQQAKLGNFLPSVFAKLHDELVTNADTKYAIEHQIVINGQSFFDYLKNEEEINIRRSKVNIASMEAQRIKLSSDKRVEGYILAPYGTLILSFGDENEAQTLIESFKKIEAEYLNN
jgi:tetratricopeptide (TPR) repeat protein